jgi:hypothetical protein
LKPSLRGRLLVPFIVVSVALLSTSLFTSLNPNQSAAAAYPVDVLPQSIQPAMISVVVPPTIVPPAVRRERILPGEEILPQLDDFIQEVADGIVGGPRGLYVKGMMALRIVQQPNGDPKYVSQDSNTATQFYRAGLFGTIGLLAHNFLAGKNFLNLQPGQDLILIYGNGKIEHFQVSEIADYQRLTLADIHSDFLDVDTQVRSSADQVFSKYYEVGHVLTLQTCLARYEVSDWGVRFITALPIPALQ